MTDDKLDATSLRPDKAAFIEKLRLGILDCTPQRLALANHIANYPDCECSVCGGRVITNDR